MILLDRQFWLNGLLVLVGLALCFLYFKPIFGVMDLPAHLSYQEIILKATSDHPGKQVSAQVNSKQDLELYARYIKTDQAMSAIQEDHAKHLYRWYVQVNHEDHQSVYEYTLDGRPISFYHEVKDQVYYPPVTQEEAEKMAYEFIKKEGLSIDQWDMKSHEKKQIEKRQDYYFTFQKKSPLFSMAYEQIALTISGDHVSAFMRQVHVPDDFQIKMNEVRQNNQILMYIGLFGMLCFGIVGALMGIYLLRKEGFDWQTAWRYALLSGLCVGAVLLNQSQLSFQNLTYYFSLPLKWALIIKSVLVNIGMVTVGYILPILAAVSMMKWAYPERPSLLSWLSINGYKNPFNRQIVYIAYGATLAFCLYEMAYYWVTNEYFGFFLPPSYGVNLNASISWIDGINPILQAFNPGFTEEVIFRLIPIGILLMLHQKKQGWVWRLVIFFQALIFAMCHASYPADPFYARVVELIIPALFFAYLVIKVDVMAAILTHILYDAIWFGLGHFTLEPSWGQVLYFVTFLMPLLVCFYAANQNQKAMILNCHQPIRFFNYGLTMPVGTSKVNKARLWLIFGILVFAVVMIYRPASQFKSTDPNQAKVVALDHWKSSGYEPENWYVSLTPSMVGVDDWYFAQQYFPKGWQQLAPVFLPVGCYEVMAASPDSQWKDYAFNLRVCDQAVLAQNLVLPYEAVKQSSTQPEPLMNQKFEQLFGVSDWRVISDAKEQFPNRTVISQVAAISQYQGVKAPGDDTLRVKVRVDGDEVTAFNAGLHISQEEAREYLSNQSWLGVFQWKEAIYLAAFLLFLGVMVRFSGMNQPYQKSVFSVIVALFWLSAWADMDQAIVVQLQQGSGLFVGYVMMAFSMGIMFIFAYVIKEILYALRAVWLVQHPTGDQDFSVGLALLYSSMMGYAAQFQTWESYQTLVYQILNMMHSPWLMWPEKVVYLIGFLCFVMLSAHMLHQLFSNYFKAICLLVGMILFTSQLYWVDPNGFMIAEFFGVMLGFWLFASLMQRSFILGLSFLLTVIFAQLCMHGIFVPAVCLGLLLVWMQIDHYLRDRGSLT
jgi:hypothetical protein